MQKKYTSPSTDEPCTAAQLITEILLTRQARAAKEPIPFKFWNSGPWKKKFRFLILQVNAKLKVYPAEALIRALNSEKGKFIYSLRYPTLDEMIQKEEKYLNSLKKSVEEGTIELPDVKKSGMKIRKKDNTLSRLRDLDG